MASSYPSGQSEQTLAAPQDDSTPPQHPTTAYSYPLQEDSEPPSPNGISAAAILATLSDSRPPTSHGEDAAFEDDDETGGISLTDDDQGATHVPPYYTPAIPTSISEVIYASGIQDFSMDQPAHAAMDQHAAALEALSMEQVPILSAAPPSIQELFVAPPTNSAHAHDFALSAYEEHLSIQDVTAFTPITTLFNKYAETMKMVRPGLDMQKRADVINREDLNGEQKDFQGIDWSVRCPRASMRAWRVDYERERAEFTSWHDHGQKLERISNNENFFSFRRMITRHCAWYPHFQLRNVMAATSRNDIYYATRDGIVRTDASGSLPVSLIDIRKQTVNGNPCQITTLAAEPNVLIAGGFEGEYAIVDLSSSYDAPFTLGVITDWSPDTKSYITNHVHLFNSRHSYTPQAVLCSNDSHLRVLDCVTNSFTYSFTYPSAVNCSATSPDGRMRVVVGDFHQTLITNAETGRPFETLKAHKDDAFACAWADDGIHVASAAQDSTIAVWDARWWGEPLALLPAEQSIPRILRFSPVGSGPRVLVAAEADDYINIINAQTFESKQVFDLFGPTAGISMTPDGQSLFVANSERRFGGIVELERTGWGEAFGPKYDQDMFADEHFIDWEGDDYMQHDRRVPCSFQNRERRGLDLGDLVV